MLYQNVDYSPIKLIHMQNASGMVKLMTALEVA